MATPCEMWSLLPEDVQTIIVKKIRFEHIQDHRTGLRRLGRAFARNILWDDWRTSKNPEIIVAGILELCCNAIRNRTPADHQVFSADVYSSIYTTVYDRCTARRPHNQTVALYQQLHQQLPASLNTMELKKRVYLRNLIISCFNFMDRFYVKQYRLEPLRDSLPL